MAFALCKNGISYCAATALLLAAVRGRGGEGRGGEGEGRGEVSQCAYQVNIYTCRVSHEKYAHLNVYTVHIQFPALKVVLHA